MIFVTLGNVPIPFHRLAEAVDRIAQGTKETFVVQHGHTPFDFSNAQAFDFIESGEMQRYIEDARVVISHGGWGTISECIKRNKKIIVVPRKTGPEHNHDQEELTFRLGAMKCIMEVKDTEYLEQAIETAAEFDFQPIERGDASSVINEYLSEKFEVR